MTYKRLTKEQLESLPTEFANFLATQSIDKKEWDKIKLESPEKAEQQLDVFSDMVWDGVLDNTKYLEHFSKNHIFLFHCQEIELRTIIIKALNADVDFLTKDGLQWLSDNLFTQTVDLHVGKKQYSQNRKEDLFKLITEGAILSDGQLFIQINELLQK